MCIFAKISPSIKLTSRLSCNTNIRRYTSLVQVQNRRRSKGHLLRNHLTVTRLYGTNGSDVTSKGFFKAVRTELINTCPENSSSSIMPIALIDLNPSNNNSSKVLLIPINWQEADEHSLRNTITSIFLKPKNLQQIEEFSQAYQETKENAAKKLKDKKNIETKKVTNIQKQQLTLKDLQLSKNKNANSISIADNLEHVPSEVEKSLQHCCSHSMQMFIDDNFFGTRITGLNSGFGESKDLNTLNNVIMAETLSPSSTIKKNSSEIQCSSLTHVMFPLSFSKKFYSTKSALMQQSTLANLENFKILTSLSKSPTQKVVTLSIRRLASNTSTRSKCNPNYDFPYLSKLFGTKELLMSCDAYNQAIVEAAKRRAALVECTALTKNFKTDTNGRPKVVSIKGCSAPSRNAQHKLQPIIETSNPCPPPTKPKKQANDGCKKDDPCKSPECPNPCKDEMEKLKRQSDEAMKKKRNKMPTGCESPKCKKDDSCTKLRKSPCKKATNQQTRGQFKYSKSSTYDKQMKDNCKKDNPCKPPECSNPCKNEIEKFQNKTDKDMKRKQNKTPTGCISPKCKKDDGCTKLKKNPCKKASDRVNKCSQAPKDSQESLECSKQIGGIKDKYDSCGKTKNKAQKNPCLDEHTEEYKPKFNADPCKKDDGPCGGAKKTPAGPSANKKADSCGSGKKQDPLKKAEKKEDPCKKKDTCGDDKQKEDPCKKNKKDPCKSNEENPCKKRKPSPCGSRKENPCKNDPCGGKKDDPCKKQKEDPCKKKKEPPKSPCGNKKEDPCKKDKDDTCEKKKSGPCVSGKKKPTSPCKPINDIKTKCQKSSSTSSSKKQACGKPKKETKPNCGQNKKYFGTLAARLIRQTYSSYTAMPSLNNKNSYSFGFMRNYSSKSDGNKKNSKDLGRDSQCKSVATNVPPKRKPAYNPHPKDGLRKCYPTYDMDCKKLCKDARKTDCRKYAFLKDTDNNKRYGKK